MMGSDEILKTKVDQLINLVSSKHVILLSDAAKRLNVSVQTVESWANFLEEEGLIKLQYKFTTPYLVAVKKALKQKEIKVDLPKEEKSCPECGAFIKGNQKFCTKCGHKVV